MKVRKFMAIAPMFASEDETRRALCKPFRYRHDLFVTDGRIALIADASGLDADHIVSTSDERQQHVGDKLLDYIKAIKADIECRKYCGYGLCSIQEAVCAAFADLEPDMMLLRINECYDDDPDADGLPDSVRYVHSMFSMVIMANPARTVISGYCASLIAGLTRHFGPVAAYSDIHDPQKPLYFQGDDWSCVLMPRRVNGNGYRCDWDYGGCSIADAATGGVVWRHGNAGTPDIEALRRGVAE